MTIYTWGQMWGLWDSVGGARNRGAMMASIAEAESSGNSLAISPAGALGLWQIMPFWASEWGWRVESLLIGVASARGALRISGNGYHVGAWDTCYNPVSSAADRRDLSEPMVGSPAWNIWHGHGGGPGSSGGGGVQTYQGPDAAEQEVIAKVAWANHLQENAIPNNTRWVAYNTVLHNTRIRINTHVPQP